MMIQGALAGFSLLVLAAVDPVLPGPAAPAPRAVIQSLIRSADECIARTVAVDPRFRGLAEGGSVNELIVESIPACLDALHALIDQHDLAYGEGSGESFFMGPYLDALPAVVNKLVKRLGR